ncbi:hypothetical protein [Almyronema epifaneia]|uniref:Phycobilisome protein n=1 Tax=Almyronema epifaneia S1 TaxID=2991925 RepID=A0ABW6IJX0_9CYAN
MVLSLPELKQEAYLQWETLLLERGVYNPCPLSFNVGEAKGERLPYTNSAFRDEMRRYGDLRRRDTWEKAAIQLTAQGVAQGLLEAYQVIGYIVSPSYMNCPIRQHYGERLIEAMFQFPEIIDLIRQGLEQVYTYTECDQEKQLVTTFISKGHQLPGLGSLALADRRAPYPLSSRHQ